MMDNALREKLERVAREIREYLQAKGIDPKHAAPLMKILMATGVPKKNGTGPAPKASQSTSET